MSINFPSNPVNGQTYDYLGVRYSYLVAGDNGLWRVDNPDMTNPATIEEVDLGEEGTKYITPEVLEGSKYNGALDFLIPKGVIVMWAGAINQLPLGWQLCDGSFGAPDLLNKFIVGAGDELTSGDLGGSADSVIVEHSHTATATSGGAHAHSAASESAGGHSHGGSTSANGSHSHTQYYETYLKPGNLTNRDSSDTSATLTSRQTSVAPNHSHSLSITSVGGHTHPITVDSVAGHNHSVSVDNEGVSGVGKNLPPYYALAYIMKS